MKGVHPLRGREFRPWKNGGGETAEILVSPAGAGFDDFDWRISTAIVASDGPFSLFPGVDRVLTVIEGGAMELELDGLRHRLDAAAAPLAFPGDAPVSARLEGGSLLDLNVMARRPLRITVAREKLDPVVPSSRAALALLMEDHAGLARLDLIDLHAADPALLRALAGASALTIEIRDEAPRSSP